MGFRFRKSVKLAPGINLNFNKKSVGITTGVKGAKFTVNSKGKTTTSVGLPGTGLSYQKISNINNSKTTDTLETEPPKKATGCLTVAIWLFLWPFYPFYYAFKTFRNPEAGKGKKVVAAILAALTLLLYSSVEIKDENQTPSTTPSPTPIIVNSPAPEKDNIIDSDSVETNSALPEETPSSTTEPTPTPTPEPIPTPTPEPTPTPIPQPVQQQEVMVWIPTNGGTKYHSRSGCSKMVNPAQVTLSHAQSLGFTACGRCY